MQRLEFSAVSIGDEIALTDIPAITRTTLALYCGASGDHNPIHVDIDFARKAKMQDVFAHGMLSAAYLGRLLTKLAPQEDIRSMSVRFTGITNVGDQPKCIGRVIEKSEDNGEKLVRLSLGCQDQNGAQKLIGEAVVAAL
ncbi:MULTISPECIES: MaoC/PaaZ C-terminal domain-containing protein [unclassified Achromobacter]|uniref:MaoC/PaaZ C-terminal domain-containing protein n=1 Tax=unclassified Achromobacter TaxID=2626865 RepID=UPI000B0F3C58|nr:MULTISPECIES: MaoC/PaaZ C-terminal domain-containing protein [unclassified Achromobacter]MDH1302119.1 MaoC/PaaZ C-terminal domain-containing protein [Achromobacter sp. GD03932]